MADQVKFDAAAVADRARQIADLEKEIGRLREAADRARSELSSAEVQLANLRRDFTRMVSPQLDEHELGQRPRRRGEPA